ncbi:MAG TPA: SusC/RagA family TonB-linked outer membrane protein [Chitinophagaceae bacterium]|nr:SusC/RagA family TonB-linked outer membrane protein [Chitinophagaceae bacterium]
MNLFFLCRPGIQTNYTRGVQTDRCRDNAPELLAGFSVCNINNPNNSTRMRPLTVAANISAAKHLLLCCLLLLATTMVMAQQKTISGTVKNANDGTPVAKATVQIKGSPRGVSTNDKGEFSIEANENETLVVSAIGFTPVETRIGNKQQFSFTLVETAKEMEAVVVTALGISRQQKALGYSQQQISAEDVTDARSNNWSSALSGKVAGLQLLSAGSGPVNSTRITLRGDVSLNPNNNNALIVVDGVPMSNKNSTSSGVNNAYGAGSGNDVPIDFGNNINDINPDDIESITVLKGPGATALYGSRASNGALLITTKSGSKKSNGIGVTVNSNISFNTVLHWPDYQYEYGQGTGRALNSAGEKYYSYGATTDGPSTSGTSSAYGPRFNGQLYYQYDPVKQARGDERTLWRPYKDNIKGFWRTGYTLTNNVSLEGGSDKGTARLSLTHSKNEWIMPNTGYERITAQTGLNYKLSDKLKVNTKISYTNKSSDNLPATGYNNQSIAYFMIFQNPNVDLNWYRDIWKRGQEQIDQIHPFSSFIDNPFLIAYEMTNSVNNHNVVGSLSATYEISKKFDLMIRSGINLINEDRQQRRPFSTANFLKGYYKEQAISDFESNTDFLFTYRDKISRDLSVSTSVGGNKMVHRYNRVDGYIDGLVIPAVYKLNNGLASAQVIVTDKNFNVNSLYGLAAFSFKNKYFLDFTARNDWSSTLPSDNWSFFYPSVNASFVLSDIFKLPSLISFAKLRVSLAEAGNDTDPYQTQKYYGASEFASSGSVDPILYNATLKPEISNSFETGLDIRFLKNRVGIDFTFYNSVTRNQIVRVPMNWSTGYSAAFLNSGKVRNRGVELVVTSKNISNKNFSWNSTINWSKNQNRVLSLAEDLGGEDNQIIGVGGNATLIAKVGGSTGDIYGFGFVRSPDGQIVYNSNGLPQRPGEIQFIGSAFADWKGGIQNEFSYKNFRFSFLVDGQYGGIIYSQSHHKMTEQGKLKHTLRGREENFIIGDGVVVDAGGRYIPNTKQVLPVDYFTEYYRRANVEANSFDASYLKLREARLEYNLPKKVLDRSFIRQVTVALYGRDLLMLTSFPVFDPETAALNGSTLIPGVEMGQLPSTRTMGLNLTLKF